MTDAVLIIGIGNRFRGDDGFGPRLAEQLAQDGHNAIAHDGEPASLIETWQGHDHVVLVDAVQSGAKPGTIHHINLTQEKLPEQFGQTSTHAFGVAEAVELARVLEKLPRKIEFYGVEGANFETSEHLSPALGDSLTGLQKILIQTVMPAKAGIHL